jgi:hypothetical protein
MRYKIERTDHEIRLRSNRVTFTLSKFKFVVRYDKLLNISDSQIFIHF